MPLEGVVVGGPEGKVGSAFDGLGVFAMMVLTLLVEDAESEADAPGNGLELPALATLLDGAFVALRAPVADGDVLAALRLDVLPAALPLAALSTAARPPGFSTAVRTSPTSAGDSSAPFALATGAGGEAAGSVTAEGGIAEAVFSEVLVA